MEEKNYTWESSGRWCLNGLPTSCSYFLYFAMQSSLPIILHLHSTCCLWRMPRVHSGKCITRLVTWVVCALSVGLHSTLYTPHTQRRQVEKKEWRNVPQITSLLWHLFAHSRAATHAPWLFVNAYVKLYAGCLSCVDMFVCITGVPVYALVHIPSVKLKANVSFWPALCTQDCTSTLYYRLVLVVTWLFIPKLRGADRRQVGSEKVR